MEPRASPTLASNAAESAIGAALDPDTALAGAPSPLPTGFADAAVAGPGDDDDDDEDAGGGGSGGNIDPDDDEGADDEDDDDDDEEPLRCASSSR